LLLLLLLLLDLVYSHIGCSHISNSVAFKTAVAASS
jgi:hypothetical protein